MNRTHGTRACYVFGPDSGKGPGCRCDPCTAANRAGASARNRLAAYGRWEPYVDAGPAREHVRQLGACGIGWKRAAALSGVSTGAMSKLLFGARDRPPTRRVRAQTAAKILAVQAVPDALAPSAPVTAAGTQRRLQALVAIGWSQARLAARLGMTGANFGALLHRDQVTAATARAVRGLYAELWDQPPSERGQREKISAVRARNHARTHGWPPPAAWDDDRIDDPAAGPAADWQRPARTTRRSADLAEDAAEIMAQGFTLDQAAERLGMQRKALGAALSRARRTAA